MNEEVLNQEGLNEELRTYIESNIPRSEEIEPAEEVSVLEENSTEEIVEESSLDVTNEVTEEVADSEVGLTEDDFILEDEVEDDSELND